MKRELEEQMLMLSDHRASTHNNVGRGTHIEGCDDAGRVAGRQLHPHVEEP